MPVIFDLELPLYKTFTELMRLEAGQNNRGVDLSSYLLLIETLKNGYCLNSKDELLFLCKKLWLKPFHAKNKAVNEHVLENLLESDLSLYADISDRLVSEKKTPSDLNRTTRSNEPEINKTKKENGTDRVDPLPKTPSFEAKTISQKTGNINLTIQESTEELSAEADGNFNKLFSNKVYFLDKKYLPISRRFMEQTIRSLRYKLKGAGRPIIDVVATVNEVARKGYFEEWQTTEEEGFVTRWTLLIDHEGSMVAFQDMMDALVQSITQGTMKNDGDIFYFRNYPVEYLYTNLQHTRSVPFRQVAAGPMRNIIIISDAGAARGSYNEERIQKTYGTLYRLRKHRLAWLNPMPKERWKYTSAEEIASFTNMLEFGNENNDTMGNLIRLLKSKFNT